MRKQIHLPRIGLCLLAILVSTYPIGAQKNYKDLVFPPLNFTTPRVERQTLDNGMTIFLVEDHELPVISMYALVKTGTIYEPADKIGLGTVTAEVMRTGGTRNRTADEINDTLEYLAAGVEVSVDEESGAVELWTLKKNLAVSLEIFADVLMNPVFDQEKVDLAKAQMLESIRRRNDEPENIASREFMRLVYGKDHPLARIPQIATIDAITREDLVAFHHAYFQPNNIMLAVSGDIDLAAMSQQLRTTFQNWPRQEVTFPPVAAAPAELTRSINIVPKDVEQTNLVLGHIGIKADNPDYPAIRVLDLILGSGGFGSRLAQKVRTEKGLAYSVGSYLGAGTRDKGVFMLYCGTRNDAVRDALAAMLQETTDLTTTAVSDTELQAAKNQYLNSFVFKFATVNDIIHRQMFYEYVGYPPDYLETFRERVMAVTSADVLRVAQTYLHPEQMTILAVGNASEVQPQLATLGAVQAITLEPVE
jgi:zinc protease